MGRQETKRMNDETREEQYLRILTSGIRDESDYEAAKYMKGKVYADCDILFSNMAGSMGDIIHMVYIKTTPEGKNDSR